MGKHRLRTFEIFPWDKNFETGISIIDEQHKKLVNILNQLAAHLANRSNPVILNQVFNELVDYADYHFKTEEKIWCSHFKSDDWYIRHERTHKLFIDRVVSIKEVKNGKPLDVVIQDIVSFLSNWLASHILDSDKRMAKVVLAIESGNTLEQAKVLASEHMGGSTKILIDTVLTMYGSLSTRTLDLMREKTLRIQAEEALLTSEEHLKFFLEGSGEDVWDWNIEKDEKSSSKPDSKIFDNLFNKLQEEEQKSKIHPADIKRVKADIKAHLNGETEFYINKHRVLSPDTSWSWILTRGKVVSRDKNGNALRMVGTHSDITERELASLIYQHSDQAMFVTDSNNTIISINPAFTQITGYTREDIIGVSPRFLASEMHDNKFYKEMWDSINTVGCWNGEIWNKRKSGEIFCAYLSINRSVDPNGSVDHYIALFSDITQYKQTEEALRRSQKMDAIGQLTGGISHDLNNILAVIQGNIETLEKQILTDSRASKSMIAIKKASLHAANLTSRLLLFLRNQTAELLVTDINQIIDSMKDFIRHSLTPQIKIEYQFAGNLWLTKISPGEFEDALINLIINARDAMTGHGHLTIATRNTTVDTSYCETFPYTTPGDYVELNIGDSGEGIPLDQQARIFDPFFTTKEPGKGTGLGLAMVFDFVKRADGFITCDSEIGVGTTFKLYLPRLIGEERPNEQPLEEIDKLVHGTETILVVDDEPSLLMIAKDSLEAKGYRVLTATDGREALESLAKEPNVDLLFSDIVMPGSINGYELAEKATIYHPKLKILLTSGCAGMPLEDNSIKRFQSNLLSKPYSQAELIKRVRENLDND